MNYWWCCVAEDDGVKIAEESVLAVTARVAGQDFVEDLANRGMLCRGHAVTVRVRQDEFSGNVAAPAPPESFRFRLRWFAEMVEET
jgi:leucyl aminopeptidase (aminopeptidase T)